MTQLAGTKALLRLACVALALTAFWPDFAPATFAQAPAPSPSAKIWEGRHAEFEAFIRTAEFERIEDVPIGVTRPKRAFFKPGGPVASVAWKVLPPGRQKGYWESYKSEIAAYELDKLLGLGMVPVTVEKQWKYDRGAAVLWLSSIRSWKEVSDRPKPPHWDRQAIRMKMFDNLICNKDRNAGNLLVDDAWNLFLIDHSRAFISDNDLPVSMVRVDRELWDRMLALDEATLTAVIGKWVNGSDLRAILKRRDKMKAAIDRMVKARGEAAVFVH
jgi:hypothetical protein